MNSKNTKNLDTNFDYQNSEELNNIVKNYFNNIKSYPLLTKQEEIILAKKVKEGDLKAREKLINSNLRLVIHIAKKMSFDNQSFQDSIDYGNLGLITAVDKFDYKLGYRFSTYASFWITQSIRKFNNNADIIRIPAYYQYIKSNINKIIKEYYQANLRYPDSSYIKKQLELRNIELNISEIDQIISSNKTSISLNQTSKDRDNLTLIDMISDKSVISPIEFANNETLHALIIDSIDKYLDCREQKIIKMYFGYLDRLYTLEEIGNEFNLTRERIRQIKNKAVYKLKIKTQGLSVFAK